MAQNPFDHAFSHMKVIQSQIDELREALHTEREERGQDVAALGDALAHERAERNATQQQTNQNLEHSVERLSSAQDRIRFDMGDLRAKLEEVNNREAADFQHICDALNQEAARIQSAIDALKLEKDHDVDRLDTDIKASTGGWMATTTSLNTKLDSEAMRLSNDTAGVAKDLFDFREANDTMSQGVQQGVGIIAESLKSFGQLAMLQPHSGQTTACSSPVPVHWVTPVKQVKQ